MAGENPHLTVFKAKHLIDGEMILAWCRAFRDNEGYEGAAIVTDRRVAFIRKGLLSTSFEPWPIEKISSVESRRGLLFFDFKLRTSGDKLQLRSPDKDGGQQWVDTLQRHLSARAAPAQTQQAAPSDPAERLANLKKLKDSGMISEEEFEQLRQQILSSL